MDYDYEITYKNGVEDVADDALLRVPSSELSALTLPIISTELMDRVQSSWEMNVDVASWFMSSSKEKDIKILIEGKVVQKERKSRIGIENNILFQFHASIMGCHSGVSTTLQKFLSFLYWKRLKKYVRKFVRNNEVCQCNKYDWSIYHNLLQPLPVMQTIFFNIFVGFTRVLPNSQGKEVILVVVDRLTKYNQSISLNHPYSVATIVQIIIDQVIWLHCFPSIIVTDRYSVYITLLWQELIKHLRVTLFL